MRRILFLLVALGVALQAFAAHHVNRMSIGEFEKMLAAIHGQSDGKVAHQVAEVELTERASSARLAQWEAEFPGRHCREVLTELADNSALLDLPASEIPDVKAPGQQCAAGHD